MRPLKHNRTTALAAIALAGAFALGVTGCSTTDADADPSASNTSTESEDASEAALAVDVNQSGSQVLSENQEIHSVEQVDEAASVDVDLSASQFPDGVSRADQTITISQAGTYTLSGTFEGQVQVNVPDGKVTLILDNASITAAKGSALAAVEVDELTVVLAANSTNTLTDSATYDETLDPNASFYSAGDTTITGTGTLKVEGKYNDGISAKDGLLIESGTINVSAVDDAIRGKDYIAISGGTLQLTSGGDALTSDNDTETERGFIVISDGTISAEAQGDGIAAATDVVIQGGEISVKTGTGSSTAPDDETSTKGIKSGVTTVIENGTITVDAQDDALHSDGAIHFAGGIATVSSGDDGVHAEGSFLAGSGQLTVAASYEGIEAYHIDLAGASIDVTASDDGLNATGGSSSDTGEQMGGATGGTDAQNRPEMPADMPTDMPTDMPARGEIPEGDSGTRPQMPQGDTQGGGFGPGMEQTGDYSITISGGTVRITAEGDGLDSNGSLTISGGDILVDGPTRGGNGSVDANGEFTMTGGTLVTRGSSDMPVNPSDDSQYWIAFDSLNVASGDALVVTASDGTEIYSSTAAVSTQRVFISSEKLAGATSYTLTVNGTEAGTASIS